MNAVICDLDGLLIDSEQLHFEAYRYILGDYGVTVTRQMFIDAWLSGTIYGTHYYLKEAGITDKDEIARARARKTDRYVEIAAGRLKLMPGVEGFLKRLNQVGIPMGVGTGGYRKEYEFSIKECGLNPYVQAMVGGDDAPRNKPAPDIFLEVAKRLNADPEQCVVFENSVVGLNAGLAAGMHCIVIPSDFTADQDFSKADELFSSIEEVDLSKLFVA
ncbi:MAG: HAD family phosphatase [Candidatus Peregrinibacteria bacterium]|nr:HAD family phosphatase [Candidatus Peregrinibacteria bacterium]